MVRGSRLVAKVEEALQHRTRTIDFTLSAINGHARVLRRSGCSKATQRSVAVAVFYVYPKSFYAKKQMRLFSEATSYYTMKETSHSVGSVWGGFGPTPECADSGFSIVR